MERGGPVRTEMSISLSHSREGTEHSPGREDLGCFQGWVLCMAPVSLQGWGERCTSHGELEEGAG